MRWLYLGIALLLGACSTGGVTEREYDLTARLPTTFTGTLPCADCPGIDYHLNLFQDGVFYLRMRYQDRPDGQFDDIGRYLLSADGSLLSLQGGREAPLRFTVENPDSLRLLGLDGAAIVSELNYSLQRQAALLPIAPRLLMRGMYRYMADAGRFTECITGRDMPVATEADNAAMEAAYSQARSAPGAPLLVSVEGQIAPRMPMEGTGPIDTLVPERFISVFPGETCAGRMEDTTGYSPVEAKPVSVTGQARRVPDTPGPLSSTRIHSAPKNGEASA
ncbi:MAG: copper resistance protein NlpE N-terminal domain-containing protein [Halioglobus sp.]|nr:copper resistance protein NlpE N-terminal domain-containing protein [Halioglobus sp.]